MKVKFLLDENLSPRLKIAVQRLEPAIDILRVGDPGAPLLGTLDPEVLQYLEQSQRLLVTDNRTSMPDHLEAHW
jgi:predicted nuclease of predicted toxin-antitoxin system